jgi:hypothetical protein
MLSHNHKNHNYGQMGPCFLQAYDPSYLPRRRARHQCDITHTIQSYAAHAIRFALANEPANGLTNGITGIFANGTTIPTVEDQEQEIMIKER